MGETSGSESKNDDDSNKWQSRVSQDTGRKQRIVEEVKDIPKGLHVQLHKGYQAHRAQYWWDTITTNTRWFRVKYKSGRFAKDCETPCWTTFFGGRTEYSPYEPVPDWLQPLVDEVSDDLNMGSRPFNAMLLRLYFDGNDEIAWHTDGRTFLGQTPTIASLSFGADATFSMRRMTNVWPPLDGSAGDGVDRSTPQRDFVVGDGDMLVMMGVTQKHWHHRVPKERGRKPRLNINFRYIIPGPDAERGQKTYYKYMVHGDETKPRSYTYREIMTMRGGMMNFARPKPASARAANSRDDSGGGASRREKDVPNHQIERQDRTEPEKKRTHDESSKSVTTEGCNLAAYLASEKFDRSTFMALPEDIRMELICEWKCRERLSKAASAVRHIGGKASSTVSSSGKKRQQSSIESVYKGRKQSKKTSGVSTLDSFFSSSKK